MTSSRISRPTINTHGVHEALKFEYRVMASWYDSFWADYLTKTFPLPLRLVRMGIWKKRDAVVVVDVGCGTGEFLSRLHSSLADKDSRNVSCYGIEPSQEMLEQAKIKSDTVTWCQAVAESMPLEDSCADIVCSTNSFHFFRDKPVALQEMHRVLRPTSNTVHSQSPSLIITDWCADFWLVKFYHFLEQLWWNSWHGFADKYPSPLTSSRLKQLVEDASFTNVTVQKYSVRVFVCFWWGMQTVTACKHE